MNSSEFDSARNTQRLKRTIRRLTRVSKLSLKVNKLTIRIILSFVKRNNLQMSVSEKRNWDRVKRIVKSISAT